jgi:hypothetical protein
MGVVGYMDHLIAGPGQHAFEKVPGKILEMHVHDPGPMAPRQARQPVVPVQRRKTEDPAGSQVPVNFRQQSVGVGDMFEDIPGDRQIVIVLQGLAVVAQGAG